MFCAWKGDKAKPSLGSLRFSGKSGSGCGNFAVRRLLLGLIAVLALGLASCGGGGGDAHTSSAPPDITETPSALPDVSGTWSGSLSPIVSQSLEGPLSSKWCADISQSGGTLSADMLITREVTGTKINLTVTNAEGQPLPEARVWVPLIGNMPVMGFQANGVVSKSEMSLTGSGHEDIQFSGTLGDLANAVEGTYEMGSTSEGGTWTGQKTSEPCKKCDLPPEPFTAYACTDETGAATLQLPEDVVGSTVVVKVDSGLCSSETSVNITDEPQNIVCGTDKKIAVVTGNYDRNEYLLAKFGLGQPLSEDEVYKLYDGVNHPPYDGSLDDSYPNFPELFASLLYYDVVFINCGNLYETNFREDNSGSWQAALRTYVSKGGRLFVSDLSYDFLEQALPEYIDFAGSDGTPENVPEAWNAAQRGDGPTSGAAESRDATVTDPKLVKWLQKVNCVDSAGDTMLSCINGENTITITGFYKNWAQMDGLSQGGKVWLVDNADKRPLVVTVNVDSGRILFSSYHTESDVIGRVGFTPQERVLQYLMFVL
jgi:hypothetical protein